MTTIGKVIELQGKLRKPTADSTVRHVRKDILVSSIFSILLNLAFLLEVELVWAIDTLPTFESIQVHQTPVIEGADHGSAVLASNPISEVANTYNVSDSPSQNKAPSPEQPSASDSERNRSKSKIEKEFNVVTLEEASKPLDVSYSPRWRASGEFLAWLRSDRLEMSFLDSVTDEVLYKHDLKSPITYGAKVRLQRSFSNPELLSQSRIGELLLDFRWIGIDGGRDFRFFNESVVHIPAAISVHRTSDYTKDSNLNSFELNLLGVEKDRVGRGGFGFRYLRMTDRLAFEQSIEYVGFPVANPTEFADADTSNDLFGFQFLGGARRKFRFWTVETEWIFGPFINQNKQSGTLFNEFAQAWSDRRFTRRDTGLSMLVESSIGLGMKLTERLALSSHLSSLLLFETIHSRNSFGSPASPKIMSYMGLGVAASYNY